MLNKMFNPSKRKQATIYINRIETRNEIMRNGKGKKIGIRVHIIMHLMNAKHKTFHIYFDTLDAGNPLEIARRQFEELREFLEDVKNLA